MYFCMRSFRPTKYIGSVKRHGKIQAGNHIQLKEEPKKNKNGDEDLDADDDDEEKKKIEKAVGKATKSVRKYKTSYVPTFIGNGMRKENLGVNFSIRRSGVAFHDMKLTYQ